MSKGRKTAFVLGLFGVIVLFIWIMENTGGTKDFLQNQMYTSSDWKKKYQLDDKDPYGLFLFNSLLETHIQKPNKVDHIYDWKQYDSLIHKKEKATYLFIGQDFEILNNEIDTILKSVNDGSDLVLSFYNLSENVYNRIFEQIDFYYDYADSITVFAGNKEFVLYNIYQTDTIAFEWEAFGDFKLKDSVYFSLSSFMEMDNYIKVPHGKGNIYLHANPQFFYNYQILRKDGFRQAEYFINNIPKKRNVYWLELGREQGETGGRDSDLEEDTGGKKDDSYFQLLFKHPSLILAMLMIILGFILFLLFRAKRMRPIVPFIEKRKNMTLSYADTITSIYFAKESPKGLLKVQRKNFYNSIQKHFFIDLSRREGEKEIKMLSEKSNVPFEDLNLFILALENRRANDVNEKYITEIAQKQREFYYKTGIVSPEIQVRLGKYEKKYNRSLWLASLLILGGIFSILLGFNFLMNSKGIGIIFWPLGIIWIVMGIQRLRKPLAAISKEQMIIYPIIGKPKIYPLNELSRVNNTSTIVTFYFTQNRIIKINFWEMSSFDKKQFEDYISNLHKLEL